MKSSVTNLLNSGKLTGFFSLFLISWVTVDFMRDGAWWWLIATGACMAVLFGLYLWYEHHSLTTRYDIIKRENEQLRYRLAQRHEEDRP